MSLNAILNNNYVYRAWEGFKTVSAITLLSLFIIASIAEFERNSFFHILEIPELGICSVSVLGGGWFFYILLGGTQSPKKERKKLESAKDADIGKLEKNLASEREANGRLQKENGGLKTQLDSIQKELDSLKGSASRERETQSRQREDMVSTQAKNMQLERDIKLLKERLDLLVASHADETEMLRQETYRLRAELSLLSSSHIPQPVTRPVGSAPKPTIAMEMV